MSSTSLEGFLFDDPEHNCLERLVQSIASGRFNDKSGEPKAVEVRLGFQLGTSGAFPEVAKVSLKELTQAGVTPLLNRLKDEFIAAFGPDPAGTVRLRVYPAGASADPFTYTRKIGNLNGEGAVQAQFLMMALNRLAHVETQQTQAFATLVDTIGHLQNSNTEKDKTIAQLATSRAVTTSAADAQGFGPLLALAGLFIFWRPMMRAMELPENMNMGQALVLSQKKMESLSKQLLASVDGKAGDAEPVAPVKVALDELKTMSADELLNAAHQARAEGITPEQALAAFPSIAILADTIKRDPAKQAELKQYLLDHAGEFL